MNKTINQLVDELTSLAILITQNTKADVLVKYYGHTDGFEIEFYENGYGYAGKINSEFSLDNKNISETIEKLETIKTKLEDFAINQKIDFNELPYEIEEIKHYNFF